MLYSGHTKVLWMVREKLHFVLGLSETTACFLMSGLPSPSQTPNTLLDTKPGPGGKGPGLAGWLIFLKAVAMVIPLLGVTRRSSGSSRNLVSDGEQGKEDTRSQKQ